jgi:hypothetical protein
MSGHPQSTGGYQGNNNVSAVGGVGTKIVPRMLWALGNNGSASETLYEDEQSLCRIAKANRPDTRPALHQRLKAGTPGFCCALCVIQCEVLKERQTWGIVRMLQTAEQGEEEMIDLRMIS